MEQLSLKYFGTSEYQKVLAVLSPSDSAVLKFLAEARKDGYDIG